MNEERADSGKPQYHHDGSWPALLTLSQAQDVARATMHCLLCYWSTYEREPCPEQEFVSGCIHWRSGA